MKLCGIEAGGTKFVCGISDENGKLSEQISFPTTAPEETLKQCQAFILKHQPDALGIASFGPIDLNVNSPHYGYITTTPKPNWAYVNILGSMREVYAGPIGFDTDVNGAALGESLWGKAQDVDSCLYITIGTGIGGGFVYNKQCLHGLVHPEMGHMHVATLSVSDGVCPYHHNCWEGLASGPALEKRWGMKASELSVDHPAWREEARLIGEALSTLICVLSPERILLGGGVMHQSQLFPMIRLVVKERLNGYIAHPSILTMDEHYITAPGLGDDAGLLGACALGLNAYNQR